MCILPQCVCLSSQFDLDSIWTFIFGMPASSATVVGSIHNVYTEAAFLLLAMLRSMLNLVRTAIQSALWKNLVLFKSVFIVIFKKNIIIKVKAQTDISS